MEPSPPKAQKSRKYVQRPFYEPNKKTSAEIISEARSCVRAVDTKRPFTPAESSRTLFNRNGHLNEGRPPSACSITTTYTDSRPPTGKRLSPIHYVPELKDLDEQARIVEAENGDKNYYGEMTDTNISLLRHSITPQPSECAGPKFSKSRRPVLQRRVTAPTFNQEENRRVNSGPKERTNAMEHVLLQTKRSNSYGDIANEKQIFNDTINQDNNTIFFEQNIRPLLKQMELNHLYNDTDALLVNFDVLWKTLELGNMLGKSKLGSKRRSEVLTSVFKCTNVSNTLLLLKLSRLFLALEVSGRNLEAVCKLMFKVSRNKKYDRLFMEEKIIEPMLYLLSKPDQMDLKESLVYLAGTIKFLTLNKETLDELLKFDVLKFMSVPLRFSKDHLTDDPSQNKESCHMLVQVTSALGNIAGIGTCYKKFLEYNIISSLLELTRSRYQDADYFMNISRVLSKLTMHKEICISIHNDESHYDVLVDGLNEHFRNKEIAVRICYAFGNIANHVPDSRQKMMQALQGDKKLLEIMVHYFQQLMKEDHHFKNNKERADVEDVLVKVIRVIANLSMDRICSEMFSNSSKCLELFIQILDINSDSAQDIAMNIAATVNNISYYATEKSVLMSKQVILSKAFLASLVCDRMECVLEMMRVLGNFTRTKSVREVIIKETVFELIVSLLDANDPQLIFCTCGVLINLMVDVFNRPLLKSYGAIVKLVDILKDLAESDWLLAGMVCQILWNYSEKIKKSVACFGVNETDELITVLNELLEPELSLDYEARSDLSDDVVEQLCQSWHDNFQPVASALLKRIEMYHTELEPIIEPD